MTQNIFYESQHSKNDGLGIKRVLVFNVINHGFKGFGMIHG